MKLIVLKSATYNPYYNLAIEELAFNKMRMYTDMVLLYTWVNEQSVIIGRNQNPYVECNLAQMDKDGIHLVRRKTGGGAVYHDLGNLNYTFIGNGRLANKETWNRAIINAIGDFGLTCKTSGRNDFQVDGFKISGSAYMQEDDTYLQHGTMLIGVRIDAIKRYLTPQKSKLLRHGIKSVEQRVCNLSEMNPEITIKGVEDSLQKSLLKSYESGDIQHLTIESFLHGSNIKRLSDKYASREFLFGEFTSNEQYSDDGI